jgi:hypothetical protein
MDRNQSGTPTVEDIGERVREDIKLIRRAAERQRDQIVDRIQSMVEQQPFLAVGAAFGIGYLLSGALFSRATAKMLLLTGRLAFGVLLREVMDSSGIDLSSPSSPTSAHGTT